ncbi:MAG: AraC family transcriptional regulator [Verrucomicrobiales bacterium]|nr:AraC family transcriptional regulator [Verrucomicrobiales bacterium]
MSQELRERFFRAIPPESHFYRLFDHLPGVLFFAKDRDGRLLAANRALLRLYGYPREEDFWGVTDFELLPRSLAEKFRQDDLHVIETGEPMLEILEIFINPQGIPGWFITDKLPVVSTTGEVIGVMGTIRPCGEHPGNPVTTDAALAPALRFIGENFHRDIAIPALADMCGLSERQFERKFKQHLRTSPLQFLIKTRVYAACDDLRRTSRALASIATAVGFYDQAAFTRQFRKHMGTTPLAYRRQFR